MANQFVCILKKTYRCEQAEYICDYAKEIKSAPPPPDVLVVFLTASEV